MTRAKARGASQETSPTLRRDDITQATTRFEAGATRAGLAIVQLVLKLSKLG